MATENYTKAEIASAYELIRKIDFYFNRNQDKNYFLALQDTSSPLKGVPLQEREHTILPQRHDLEIFSRDKPPIFDGKPLDYALTKKYLKEDEDFITKNYGNELTVWVLQVRLSRVIEYLFKYDFVKPVKPFTKIWKHNSKLYNNLILFSYNLGMTLSMSMRLWHGGDRYTSEHHSSYLNSIFIALPNWQSIDAILHPSQTVTAAEDTTNEILDFKVFKINFLKPEILYPDGRTSSLASTQALRFLKVLFEHKGRPVTYEQILDYLDKQYVSIGSRLAIKDPRRQLRELLENLGLPRDAINRTILNDSVGRTYRLDLTKI